MSIPYALDPLGALPPGYKRIDTFTSTDGINFDYYATDTNEYHVVFNVKVPVKYQTVIGSYRSEVEPTQRILVSTNKDFFVVYFNAPAGEPYWQPGDVVGIVSFSTEKWYDAVLTPSEFTLDGTAYRIASKNRINPLTRFFIQSKSAAYKGVILYRLIEIRDNGKLKLKAVPAVDPNGVQCLFDLVGGKAYYNGD